MIQASLAQWVARVTYQRETREERAAKYTRLGREAMLTAYKAPTDDLRECLLTLAVEWMDLANYTVRNSK